MLLAAEVEAEAELGREGEGRVSVANVAEEEAEAVAEDVRGAVVVGGGAAEKEV